MYCSGCKEFNADNALGHGVTGARVTIQAVKEHYLFATGPNSCKSLLASKRARLAMGTFMKDVKCRYVRGKFCLYRTVHRLVKSFFHVKQFENLCKLQRSNGVDLPMEHSNEQGCKKILISFNAVYSNKLTVKMQVSLEKCHLEQCHLEQCHLSG